MVLYKQVVINGKWRGRHIVRAEKALGRPITRGIIVHHADGSIDPDAPLVICPDQAYHKLLHIRMKVKALGGNPNREWHCSYCHELKPYAAFGKKAYNKACRSCDNRFRALNKWRKRRREGRPMIARGRSLALILYTGP